MVLEAVKSILQQDYGPLEIIVVDDGSTDNTCNAVKTGFPEVHLVSLNGRGPAQARNAGVAASGGDILMFLDSDDLWLKDHARRLMDVINSGYQVAYGVTKNRDEIRDTSFFIPDTAEIKDGDCFDQLTKWCFLVPSSVAVSREAFMAVNGFDDVDCGEDWIFFLKLAARYPFGCAGPVPITLRRLHRGSLCFLHDRKKLLAMISQVFNLLEKEPRATAVQRDHFTMLHEWTAANMKHWATVQDWYLEMQREKII